MTKFSQSPIKWCWIREKFIGISYKRRIAYSYHLQFGCRHSDDVDDFRSHHHILNPTWCHHCWLAMLLLLQYLLYSLLLFLLQVLCLHLLEVLLWFELEVLCDVRYFLDLKHKIKQFFKNMIENCLRNRTTVRFDFLHSFMVCAQTSAFWYTESWDFRILNCACVWVQNQTTSKNEARQQKNDSFVDYSPGCLILEKRRFAHRP